jgi:hypothetical protein
MLPIPPLNVNMSTCTAKWLFDELDLIGQGIWDISLDNSAFTVLKQKVSQLSAQIAVHRVFEDTTSQLLTPPASSASQIQNRLSKFLDALYGSSEKSNDRWQKLLSLDCATFLFIAISFTPLDITKMHRDEFNYLLECAPKYLQSKPLPPRWMFRRDIQVALAAKADLDSLSQFRKGPVLSYTEREAAVN